MPRHLEIMTAASNLVAAVQAPSTIVQVANGSWVWGSVRRYECGFNIGVAGAPLVVMAVALPLLVISRWWLARVSYHPSFRDGSRGSSGNAMDTDRAEVAAFKSETHTRFNSI